MINFYKNKTSITIKFKTNLMKKLITNLSMKSCCFFIAIFLFAFQSQKTNAQTTLVTGDIAFSGFGFDNAADSFSVIFLVSVTSGTQITFTDDGYSDLSGFLTVGGLIDAEFVWEAPGGGVAFGEQVTFWNNSGTAMTSKGSIVSGDGLSLDALGDQIFAVQGTLAAGTILAGVHRNFIVGTGSSNWDNQGAISSVNESDLPDVLTNGVNALYFGSAADNARYNCSITLTTAAAVRAAVNDTNNWSKDPTTPFDPTACRPSYSTWDGTAWSNGAPTTNLDAVITSNTTPGTFSGKDLTINSGSALTIGNGVTATISGDIANNGNGITGVGTIALSKAGTSTLSGNAFTFGGVVEVGTGTTLATGGLLTIASGGSLMHGTGTPNGGGGVSGNITFEKNIGSIDKGWRGFSIPVVGTIDNFETGINTLCSNHTPAEERNVYYWDGSVRGGSSNNVAVGWVQASIADDQNKAYSIYLDNTAHGAWDFSSTVSMTGVPNDGTKVFSLDYTFDPEGDSSTASQRGWNFIPNPFPSNFDVTDFIASIGFDPAYKAIHIWDQSTKQMKAINISSIINYNTGGGTILGSFNHISAFTGFWVKANAVSQEVDVTNAHRTGLKDSLPPDTYFKAGFDIFRLTVKDAKDNIDQFSVCFKDDATEAMDNNLDIYKFKSFDDEVPTLYSVVDGDNLSLTAVPYLDNRVVPVYLENKTNDTEYTFSAQVSEYSMLYDVVLEDKKTGATINILENDYKFLHDKTYTANRFDLLFKRKSGVGINEVGIENSTPYVYKDASGIHIVNRSSNPSTNCDIIIYNTLGQRLLETKNVSANNVINYTPGNTVPQLYIVHVVSKTESKSLKIIY